MKIRVTVRKKLDNMFWNDAKKTSFVESELKTNKKK